MAAFQFAHVGLVITDANGIIVNISQRVSEISGYPRELLIGQRPAIFKSGRHPDAFYQAMWHALHDKGHWSGEICNRRRNGEFIYEQLSISALRDDSGRLTHYVAVFSDISEQVRAESRIIQAAYLDTLTGLPNRRLLGDRLDQAIAQCQRSGRHMATCFIDLDGFKKINDSYGHEAGDQLLIAVAQRLQSQVRGNDTVSRLGGDESVLLLNDLADDGECVQAIQRILAQIAEPYLLPDNSRGQISASIGITLYPADASDADTLLRHADQAMYVAKQAGKNCFQLYDSRLEQRLLAKQATLHRVAHGLKQQQFVLHYQPKLDAKSDCITGLEALIRWHHPILGDLEPNQFLPVIEDDDLALTVGEWTFREALRQNRAWHDAGFALSVSVNAFPRQLQRPDFPDMIQRLISEEWPTMPAGRLIIEIVETRALHELDSLEKTIERCREFKVGFSLDDFGTGYSSLTYLRTLTVDEIKIDRSFVRDMLNDHEDLSIVEAVIGLGKAFGLKVVPEGVESAIHIEHLLALGCELMQGYGIARPMPADAVLPWLEKRVQTKEKP